MEGEGKKEGKARVKREKEEGREMGSENEENRKGRGREKLFSSLT